jgi:Zn-dependent protease
MRSPPPTLIAWSLAVGVCPSIDPGLTSAAYWSMAVVATVGLLFSIVFHELSHAAVAQHFGMPIRGITLFIFGGVAEMHSEPTSALSEFLMALAGPIASAVLGFLFFLLFGLVDSSQGPAAIAGVLWYLGYLSMSEQDSRCSIRRCRPPMLGSRRSWRRPGWIAAGPIAL